MTAESSAAITAVVLSGGRGSRLGGAEKSEVLWQGRSLLHHLLGSLAEAVPVVVVGPQVPTAREVRFTLEEPRFGGPVAALAAALPLVETRRVFLVATDMPLAGRWLPLLQAELDAVDPADGTQGVFAVDSEGKWQPLCAVYDTEALRSAIAMLDTPVGAPLRAVTRGLKLAQAQSDGVTGRWLRDVDTPADLAALD